MTPTEFIKAIAYPLTEFAVLVPLVVFTVLISLAYWGGIAGVFLMLVCVLAVFRYQMTLLEATAGGRTPETPGVEFFSWFDNLWALFPAPVFVLLSWLVIMADQTLGTAGTIVALLLISLFLPASLSVLAITHSPLQSLNPLAIASVLRSSKRSIWIASVYLFVAGWLSIQAEALPLFAANAVQLFLTFSFFTLTGSIIRPYGLLEDVYIEQDEHFDEGAAEENVEAARQSVLTHAYGFISRGNRDGGFKHVTDNIDSDPDPVAAWAWYFDHMLQWEDSRHALFFAQRYIHDMLRHGETTPAVKVILRCRMIDAQFRPASEDLPAAIAAANETGNSELAAVLQRA